MEEPAIYITLVRHAKKSARPLKRGPSAKNRQTQGAFGPPARRLHQYLDANFFKNPRSQPLPNRSWGDARRKGANLKHAFPGVPVILYDSPLMRTLQTALAVSEAFHPEIKPLTAHNPTTIFDTKLQDALVQADIRPLRKLDIDAGTHEFGRPALTLRDLQNIYNGFRARAPRHIILVSHVEILNPLLRAVHEAYPEIFDRKRIEKRLERAEALENRLSNSGILKERKEKQAGFNRRIQEAEERGQYKKAQEIKEVMYEWQDGLAAAKKTELERKVDQVRKRIAKLANARELGFYELEHLTFKFTPNAASVIYRGKETQLPGFKEVIEKAKAA